MCTNQPGFYNCTCAPGSKGNGRHCVGKISCRFLIFSSCAFLAATVNLYCSTDLRFKMNPKVWIFHYLFPIDGVSVIQSFKNAKGKNQKNRKSVIMETKYFNYFFFGNTCSKHFALRASINSIRVNNSKHSPQCKYNWHHNKELGKLLNIKPL